MTSHRIKQRVLVISACAWSLAMLSDAAAADVDPWDGNWHSEVGLYGWLPGISAKTRYSLPQGGSVENHSTGNIFDKLSGALMLDAAFRKGRWGVYADIDWVKFDDRDGRFASIGGQRVGADAGLDTRWNLKGGLVTLAGSFTVGHSSQGYADLLVGAQYLWIKGNLNWNLAITGNGGRVDISDQGHLNRQTHVTDGIVGVRGRWTPFPSKAIFMPYYFDIGWGSSDRTQQYEGGIGYAFHWGDVALIYRDTEYHQHSDDAYIRDLRLSGPILNVSWVF